MRRIYFLCFLLVHCIGFGDVRLKKSDVRETFEEILNFHVEHGEMKPLLMNRAFKIYIEQFDWLKMYLLEDEARAFSRLSKTHLEQGVERYKKDDLADFIEINGFIQTAIARARIYRDEVEKELILSTQQVQPLRGETYLSYPASEDQLKTRIQKQMTRILLEEKKESSLEYWTPEDREKIFQLWEKRFRRREEGYTAGSEELQEHNLALHTLRALSKSLDAHTAYFSPDEANEMRTSLEKQFEGVGVVLRETIKGIEIADLVKGGPAEKNGRIFIGDQIVSIDGKSTTGMTYEEILDAMKGDGKKELILIVCSKDMKPREVLLIREKIMMNDERLQYTSHAVGDGQIGILTLPSFYEGSQSSAEKDMREAIKKLKKQGPLKGVILDMRENAGGFLTQAVKVAGLFISRGVVVISKYSRGEIKYLRNLDGRLLFDGPLIILTSKASASAAEIVAQALQDYGAGIIVGDEQTYGKGTIQYQTVTDKDAKAFYKVTVGRYYTVSGKSTQIEGVKADVVVPTIFSSYKIGERYLEYPLQSDQVTAAYIDPLSDIDYRSRAWFQKNYLPNLHKPQDRWKKVLPQLQENSAYRLSHDKNFVLFIQAQEKLKGRSPHSFQRISNPPWGSQDLQIGEALNIMKDMLDLNP